MTPISDTEPAFAGVIRYEKTFTLDGAEERLPKEAYLKAGHVYEMMKVTFSGGEAQRIKLAQELARRDTGRTLYILDEPTTGLHFEDVAVLMRVLRRLTALGNTVIVIEHNTDVIAGADWVVDIGPEGGNAGGQLVFEGTPEDLMQCSESITGQWLHATADGKAPKKRSRNKKTNC